MVWVWSISLKKSTCSNCMWCSYYQHLFHMYCFNQTIKLNGVNRRAKGRVRLGAERKGAHAHRRCNRVCVTCQSTALDRPMSSGEESNFLSHGDSTSSRPPIPTNKELLRQTTFSFSSRLDSTEDYCVSQCEGSRGIPGGVKSILLQVLSGANFTTRPNQFVVNTN